ncbi:MAG: hypothetical protein M3Y28_05610 [Armatimonadota bacterium]|nr:hypothetical protein [Armatimonadota bacterium]
MKNGFVIFCLLPLLLWRLTPAQADAQDIVPSSSGLYEAVALLAQEHLLSPDAPDVTGLLGVTRRLRTRAELADLVRQASEDKADARGRAALAYARNILAPELGSQSGAGPKRATLGGAGFVQPTIQGRDDHGTNLRDRGYVFGRGTAFGTLGRDGAYTVGVTNVYRETRDHASFTTRNGGTGGGDNPGVLNGVDEAYATVLGHKGLRLTGGLMRQRWGSGYRGDLLVNDNGPSHLTLQLEIPFSLGRRLGSYRFNQYEATYKNGGRTIYQGGRRLEHPIGDRVTLSLEEGYNSNEFKNPQVLFIPFYAYQSNQYPHSTEPLFFNYLASVGLTVQPLGPRTAARLYGQILIDDIKAPNTLGQGYKVPRKLGYLLGYAQAFPHSGTDVVVEYAHTDRETYTGYVGPELAWFDGDLPQGHPIGPNGKEVSIRLGQRLTPKFDLSAEFRDRRRTANDFPAPTVRSVDLGLAYHLSASQSVGLRLTDYREDPFTGVANTTVTITGGAGGGESLRRRIIGLSFLQAF